MKQYRLKVSRKHLTAGAFFLSGLFYGGISAILIFKPNFAGGAFNLAVCAACILIALANLFEFVFDNKKDGHRLGEIVLAGIMLIAAAFVYFKPTYVLAIFPIIIGGYALVNAFIKFVVFFIQGKNQEKNRLVTFMRGLFNLLFGLFLMLYPVKNISSALYIAAAYFILLSINSFTDFAQELLPPSKKYAIGDKIRRRVRITIPAFFTALIPRQALDAVNDYLLPNDSVDPTLPDEVPAIDFVPDLEIFIHVTKSGLGTVGHVDLCFDDVVFTFGGYDNEWKTMWGLVTSGVLAKIPNKENYLNFCIQYSKKSIFGFGLDLTEMQRKLVTKEILSIFDEVYEWKPKAVTEPQQRQEDYASQLFYNTNALFYKFKTSHFKTYFLGNTNCVMLADRIIGSLGIDALSVNGFITPGTYYKYLDREYSRKHSLVRSKKIYKGDEEN